MSPTPLTVPRLGPDVCPVCGESFTYVVAGDARSYVPPQGHTSLPPDRFLCPKLTAVTEDQIVLDRKLLKQWCNGLRNAPGPGGLRGFRNLWIWVSMSDVLEGRNE